MVPKPRSFHDHSFVAPLQANRGVARSNKILWSCHTGKVKQHFSIIALGRCANCIISKIVRNSTLSYLSKYYVSPYNFQHSQALPWVFITGTYFDPDLNYPLLKEVCYWFFRLFMQWYFMEIFDMGQIRCIKEGKWPGEGNPPPPFKGKKLDYFLTPDKVVFGRVTTGYVIYMIKVCVYVFLIRHGVIAICLCDVGWLIWSPKIACGGGGGGGVTPFTKMKKIFKLPLKYHHKESLLDPIITHW